MQPSLQGIANKAKQEKSHRFRDLCRMFTEEYFQDCWKHLRKDAATGVDRVTAEEYGENFVQSVRGLIERLKQGTVPSQVSIKEMDSSQIV